MSRAIPLPQAAVLYEWDYEPVGGAGNPTNEGSQEPIEEYMYAPRPSVADAIQAKLKQYFPGKDVEYDAGPDCDSKYWSMGFFIRRSNDDIGWIEYMILVQPKSYDCENAGFKAACLPSSTQQQRDAAKAALDAKMEMRMSKYTYDDIEDDRGDEIAPTQKEFNDVYKIVMDVANDVFENPMGGRRKKRKTKRRGKKRSTRKKLRR
jgi:hypothetical protein